MLISIFHQYFDFRDKNFIFYFEFKLIEKLSGSFDGVKISGKAQYTKF
jgi:hypothetical protein